MIIDSEIKKLLVQIESLDINDSNHLTPLMIKLIQQLHRNCQKPDMQARYAKYHQSLSENTANPESKLCKYPIDDDGYANAFSPIEDEETFWQTWNKYGLVVSCAVVGQEQCSETIARIHALVKALSGGQFLIEDSSSYVNIPRDKKEVPLISRGFFEVYHDDSLAQLRQSVRLYLHHVVIWGQVDLWTTFDRYGLKLPNLEQSKALPLHVDQNATVHPGFTTVQGVLALSDCPIERGTFAAVPGSKHFFKEYKTIVNAKGEYYRGEYVELDLSQPFASHLVEHKQTLPIRAGDIVSWDSQTTHANSANLSGETRMVA